MAAAVVAVITVGAFTAVWLVLHAASLNQVFPAAMSTSAPESKRPDPLPSGIGAFWKTVLSTPDANIIASQGPDAYFFVRFLQGIRIQMLVPLLFLTFVVCIPLA